MKAERARVLILYADSEALNDLQWHCESLGLDTYVTWDCCEAQRLLHEREFDLIAVGEHTPEVCSAQVLRQFRGEAREAPCIVFRKGARFPFESEFLKAMGAHEVVDFVAAAELASCINMWAHQIRGDARAAAAV